MTRRQTAIGGAVAVLLALAGALPAHAADQPALSAAGPRLALADAQLPSPSPMRIFGARPVADRALAQQRGGTETASDVALKGAVSDNRAVNVTTGANVITGGALAGAAGVPVVVQNSGNNVLIQSSVVVNVQLK